MILDDCWSAGRTENGTLLANSTKFPNGMKHVGDRLHSLGLGFGMYSSAGLQTCAHYSKRSAESQNDRWSHMLRVERSRLSWTRKARRDDVRKLGSG